MKAKQHKTALHLDTEEKRFVLDVDEQRPQEAPGFDEDHWPGMGDLGWQRQVPGYYGAQPYWE